MVQISPSHTLCGAHRLDWSTVTAILAPNPQCMCVFRLADAHHYGEMQGVERVSFVTTFLDYLPTTKLNSPAIQCTANRISGHVQPIG